MDDRYRGDDPRRSVRLASSANNGSTRDRAPLPLGVNERTRGVGSRTSSGRPAMSRTEWRSPGERAPHLGRPPRSSAHASRLNRNPPARPLGQRPDPPRPRPAHPDRRAQNQPSPAPVSAPLNGSYAHTPPVTAQAKARGGYRGGPWRASAREAAIPVASSRVLLGDPRCSTRAGSPCSW